MLREIVSDLIASQHDMELVPAEGTGDLEQKIDDGRADVVVLGAGKRGLDATARELLHRHPRLRCVVLRKDGRRGCSYRLTLDRQPFDEISTEQFVTAIRSPRDERS